MILANAIKQAYSASALAKSSAGLDIPNRSTNRCSVDAPFFISAIYGRLYRGVLVEARRSLVGYVNSVQSAALLFDINGGSSPNESEDAIMDDDARNKAVRLFSQLPIEKQHFFLIFLRTWISHWGVRYER